ncbi:MAG TPA: GNAT family N-acetyltransferase [Archangium sp.]|nr:GNAT family N-acetyltransferase [Archangium sp.]
MDAHGGLRIHPLSENEPRERFVCVEHPALEDFIRTKALRSQVEGYGRTFVLSGTLEGQPSILGYYTLVATAVTREIVPKKQRHGTPGQIPVALIGRLAVDDRSQRQGHGKRLLLDALERAYAVSREVGLYAVIVDAKDETAESFYLRYGFEPMPLSSGFPKRLYLKMETIEALVLGSDE